MCSIRELREREKREQYLSRGELIFAIFRVCTYLFPEENGTPSMSVLPPPPSPPLYSRQIKYHHSISSVAISRNSPIAPPSPPPSPPPPLARDVGRYISQMNIQRAASFSQGQSKRREKNSSRELVKRNV